MLESTEHMPKEGLRRLLQAAALSALASLGLALGTDAFVHTDDGCVVETHCVACVWHHGAVVVPATAAPVFTAPATAVGSVARLETPAPADAAPRTAPSRGPPPA